MAGYIDDTIAAISTPPGGGIGIVRVSGAGAFPIVKKLFRGKKNWESHHVYYGKIVKGTAVADEVLLVAMRGPKTYTTEDTVEINCHGGTRAMQAVLQLLLQNGARLAEPGEFTKRAFLNGRIDLSQAEAVMDIIDAKTERSHRAALSQLEGRLAKQAKKLSAALLYTLTRIEAAIDYPEYDETLLMIQEVRQAADDALAMADKLLQTAQNGRILREGLETVIVGSPNVGKSSLLNALLNEDRAIVTNIPGTTRDTLTEMVSVGGIPLVLTDTAGLRQTEDEVERLGVERSKQRAAYASLLLYVIDGAETLRNEDIEAIRGYTAGNRTVLVLVNKEDLGMVVDTSILTDIVGAENVLIVSAKQETGLEALAARIQTLYGSGLETAEEAAVLTNMRHIDALYRARAAVLRAIETIDGGLPEDFVSIDLRAAYDCVGEITGETADAELLDSIFARFCLGK